LLLVREVAMMQQTSLVVSPWGFFKNE